MAKIDIYTQMLCGYCSSAKRLLNSKGADYNEIDVTFKPGVRAKMRERAGGKNSTPQIFIGATHVGGSDELHALDAQGELDGLLARENAI